MRDAPRDWAAVVYGRTLRVDRWWRALPHRCDEDWLASVVGALVAGGQRLEGSPRFVIAQDASTRIVGGACMAHYLDTDMHSDGRRELYCFVGWACDSRGPSCEGPGLDDIERNFRRWASVEYERYVGADWDRSARALKEVHRTSPVSPHWRAPGRVPLRASAKLRDTPEAWPQDERETLWDIARASHDDYIVAVGWRRLSDADERVTHAAAEDVRERQEHMRRSRSSPPRADRHYRVADEPTPMGVDSSAGYEGRRDPGGASSRGYGWRGHRHGGGGGEHSLAGRQSSGLACALKWAREKVEKVVRELSLEEGSDEYDAPFRSRPDERDMPIASEHASGFHGSSEPRPPRQAFAADDQRSGSLPSLRPASGSPAEEVARAARVDEEWDLRGQQSAPDSLSAGEEGEGEPGAPEKRGGG